MQRLRASATALALGSLLCMGCSSAEDAGGLHEGDAGGEPGSGEADGDVDGGREGGGDADVPSDAAPDAAPGLDGDTATEPARCRAPEDRALRLFFLGNSFTFGGPIPDLVRALASSAGFPPPEVDMSAYGGYTLEQHRTADTSVNGVRAGGWDAVVLQEHSTRPTGNVGDPTQFKIDATWFYDETLKASPHARVFLYETWARHADHDIYPDSFADPAEMQGQLRFHYNDAAGAYIPSHATETPSDRAIVAPAGDAWEHHLATPDALRLHDDDNYHAGPAGQYLNSVVLYSTIYGCRAEGLSSLGLSPADAARLQSSADAITGEVGWAPADRLEPERVGRQGTDR